MSNEAAETLLSEAYAEHPDVLLRPDDFEPPTVLIEERGTKRPKDSLHVILDPFIKGFGGEVVDELMDPTNRRANADYLFRKHNVIAELKALEDALGGPYKTKMDALLAEWHRTGRFQRILIGRQAIKIEDLPPNCQNEWIEVLRAPLQRVIKKADGQIRETKILLQMPDAKGLLLLASDGNEDLQPNDVWTLVWRTLNKKKEDGSPQYSHIEAVVYFTPRMSVRAQRGGSLATCWFRGLRQVDDAELNGLLPALRDAWTDYLGSRSGVEVRQVDGRSLRLEDLKFA
jgi:hypothetical protein